MVQPTCRREIVPCVEDAYRNGTIDLPPNECEGAIPIECEGAIPNYKNRDRHESVYPGFLHMSFVII
ncbi:hypothetical protein DXB54_10110 [Coprococcus sp. OM04-5BH]|nr:hypothetical protein DXB54_10110 [Coprococcus sp. OM04-5BH]